MIIRIHMEDQYRLDDVAAAQVDKQDDALMAAMDARDMAAFTKALRDLLTYVREHGARVPQDELVPSDVILPSEDMTLDEAHAIMEKAAATSAAQE